jgi:hypothetical protein
MLCRRCEKELTMIRFSLGDDPKANVMGHCENQSCEDCGYLVTRGKRVVNEAPKQGDQG